jgi:hypothetical protein
VADGPTRLREGLMEMRIVVPDAASASVLAHRLGVAVGSDRITLRGERPEIDVLIDREPDSAILRVLDAVERWLDQSRVGPVEMWLGDRSYTFARCAVAETWH